MSWCNILSQLLINLSGLLDLTLFFFKQSIFYHEVNNLNPLTMLQLDFKLSSNQCKILQVCLYKLGIIDPELQVIIKWDQCTLIDQFGSLDLILWYLESNVVLPGLLLMLNTLILLPYGVNLVLIYLSLLDLVTSLHIQYIFNMIQEAFLIALALRFHQCQ